MNNLTLFSISAFVAVVLLVEGVYYWYSSTRGAGAKQIQRRLQVLSAGDGDAAPETSIVKKRLLSEALPLEHLLLSVPRVHELDRLLVQSGTGWSVSKLLGLTAAAALVGFALGTALLSTVWFGGLLAAVLLGVAPSLWVMRQRGRRLQLMQQQLPDALDLITRALRAGHAFTSGLKMVGEELPEPLASEFRLTNDEINYGVSLHDALTHMTERVPGTDLRFFVVAVLTQREAGGNLTEILVNLSKLIRSRFKLRLRIKTLSAEGKLSAWILCLMPFALAGLLQFANPEFISILWTDPTGILIVKIMLGLMAAGALIMRKIIRIHV